MKILSQHAELHDIPTGTVVQDADGQVWCVVRPRCCPGEVWLMHFSDEYAFCVKPDGQTAELGDIPKLPLRVTDLVSEPIAKEMKETHDTT